MKTTMSCFRPSPKMCREDWQRGSPGAIRSVGTNTAQLIADVVEPEDDTLKPVEAVSREVFGCNLSVVRQAMATNR